APSMGRNLPVSTPFRSQCRVLAPGGTGHSGTVGPSWDSRSVLAPGPPGCPPEGKGVARPLVPGPSHPSLPTYPQNNNHLRSVDRLTRSPIDALVPPPSIDRYRVCIDPVSHRPWPLSGAGVSADRYRS